MYNLIIYIMYGATAYPSCENPGIRGMIDRAGSAEGDGKITGICRHLHM